MTTESLKLLLDLLIDLRDRGVKTYKDTGWEVEFFPPEPKTEGPILPRAMTQNAPFEEDKCACGHMQPAHNADGLCLLGCDASVCARSPKDDSAKR